MCADFVNYHFFLDLGTSDVFVRLSIESMAGKRDGHSLCGEPVEQTSQIKWKDLNPRYD